MTKLPLLKARELEILILQLGFKFIRQKGSHVFYRHADGRYTTIPHHQSRIISRPLLYQIIKQIKISPEEFLILLEK